MSDMYHAEQAVESSRQEALRLHELERQLAQAQTAEAGAATISTASTESEAMRAQLQDRVVLPEVEAAHRIDAAQPGDKVVPGQMTDTPLHQQGDKPDCLLQSARMAEHRQTGVDPGLDAYKTPAMEKHIYDPSSGITDLPEMTKIMDNRPGIEAELKMQQTPQELEQALNNGDSAVVAVDAYEFYKDQVPGMQPDSGGHAIVVTSAEQLPDGQWKFTVNDSNVDTPNVPAAGEKFLNAWNQAGRPMVVVRKTGVM